MPLKQQHTDAEIEALAATFRGEWHDGKVVKSWLKAHAEELRRLVREEDWSWVNIGRALSLAGIAYRTGNAWKGETLRKAVTMALRPSRRGHRKPMEPSIARQQMPMSVISAPPKVAPDAAAEFRIVRRRPAPDSEINPSKGEP